MPRSKYGAVPTTVDNVRFASKKEAAHYGMLKILERAGKIKSLELQPKFPLHVNGQLICTYIGDFRYVDAFTGETDVQDVKGMKTPAYRIKKKLVKAIYGVEIQEV